MRQRPLIIAASAALLMSMPAYGHDSPASVIEALSERIECQGATARLLISRAYEHQSLGNWNAVAADFSAALELEPRSRTALSGCAEAFLQLDALPQAESMVLRGLALDEDPSGKSPFYALLARVFARQESWLDALNAWRGALQSPQPEIDWFLGEEECLNRLGRHLDRVEALAQAMNRNPSVVLHRAWIRALVDAGELETASLEIESGMAQSRWQSYWLLLRAKIHGLNQGYIEQQADAANALTEIQSRLNLERPDPYLVVESARALAFMGEREQALDYIEKARDLGVSEADLSALMRTIEMQSLFH
jgi:tetratricopeptide (TPR) repeat protein